MRVFKTRTFDRSMKRSGVTDRALWGGVLEKKMATKKRKSRILGEMHETAFGLHDAGVISKRRMSEFEALCHLDVHEMPPLRSGASERTLVSVRPCSPPC
jgi:hypothetical protein